MNMDHSTPLGVTVPVLECDQIGLRIAGNEAAPPGLGTWAVVRVDYMPSGIQWVYCPPNRAPARVSHYGAEPPPLPQAEPRKCGCHQGSHSCGSCGQPYWVEIHGFADGYCSYCYVRG